MSKHLLFVCYGGGHIAMLYPIIKALTCGDRFKITTLALTTAQSFLEQKKVPYIGYKDFSEAKKTGVRQWGEYWFKKLRKNELVSQEESIAYLGINFCELIDTYGQEKAESLYIEKGRSCFLPVKTMEHLLKTLSPDLLIATNSPRTEQAAFLAARGLGIPSVCLVDLFALQEIKWIGQPKYADRICVLNEWVRNKFIESGRKKEEVSVTGNPVFDNLYHPSVLRRGSLLKQEKKWDDGKFNILWASQPEPEKHPFCEKTGVGSILLDKIECELRNFIKKNENYRLIIRHHPSENVVFKKEKDVELSTSRDPLEPLLHAVDLVVVTASTVGLQAHIIGKPVISVDSTIWAEDVQYAQQRISIGIDSPKKLSETVEYVRKFWKKKSIEAYICNATENVIKVVENTFQML